jgi:UPF0148 protein
MAISVYLGICSDDIVVVFKRMWRSQFAVMFMDEEKMLKRMTRLLEQGCTMLASHHDCGAPLFRCQGEIICPVCSPGGDGATVDRATPALDVPFAEGERKGPGASPQRSIEPVLQDSEADADGDKIPIQDEQALVKQHLHRVLLHRLKGLSRGMECEEDLDKMRRQLGCIEGILRILNALER